jgi:putative tributyrin esterase
MALMHVNYFSNVLGKCMQMDVIIPQGTSGQIGVTEQSAVQTYPTLYLLHGMSDDNTIWQRRTSIERYAADYNLAVVMPDGDLSWYTDMYCGGKYFTYIAHELPAICRDFFPKMSTKREETFVAGLSMGGYGTMKVGLNCSETFGYAASLSGAVDMRRWGELGDPQKYWESIFGPLDKFEGSESDLVYRASWLKTSGKPIPKFYMWCGLEDWLLQQNHIMRDELNRLGYDLTYEESHGNHEWKYWDEKIQSVLKWLPLQSARRG